MEVAFDWQKYALELKADLELAQEELRQLKRESDGLAAEFRREFGMTQTESLICACLLESLGNTVPYDKIYRAACIDHLDDPRNNLGVHLTSITSKIQGGRLYIDTDRAIGLRMMPAGPLFRSHKIRAGSNAPTGTGAGAS